MSKIQFTGLELKRMPFYEPTIQHIKLPSYASEQFFFGGWASSDSWYKKTAPSSFEIALNNKIAAIKIAEQQLTEEAKTTPKEQPQKLAEQYQAVIYAKKIASLCVEHMQKIMQSIAANFH